MKKACDSWISSTLMAKSVIVSKLLGEGKRDVERELVGATPAGPDIQTKSVVERFSRLT